MTKQTIIVLLLLFALSPGTNSAIAEERHNDTRANALICIPDAQPPFPAVVFNHGGIVEKRGLEGAASKGYDLRGICRAFSEDGFLAFMPIRRGGLNVDGANHLVQVLEALFAVKARPDVDARRVFLAGFLRGGLLTFLASVHGASAQSFVLLAPAPGKDAVFQKSLGRVDTFGAPVLVMVELGDQAAIKEKVDRLEEALRAAGKPHKAIRYERGKGHGLFAKVDYYWPDLIRFLRIPAQDSDAP